MLTRLRGHPGQRTILFGFSTATGALARTPFANLLDCLASSPPSGLTVSRLLYDACQCPRRRQLRQVSMLGHAGDRQ